MTKGFSTLEALAALMVLNLLLTGLMGRQLQAWQAQREVLAHQHTIEMAQDLWHRMQLNPDGLGNYQLNLDDKPSLVDCQNNMCNASDWAQADLAEWHQALQLRMPGGQAQLQTTITAPPSVRLMLAWPQQGSASDAGLVAVSNCPSKHRCWQTSWPP